MCTDRRDQTENPRNLIFKGQKLGEGRGGGGDREQEQEQEQELLSNRK